MRLLAALDDSPVGESVLAFAAPFANALELHLVTVLKPGAVRGTSRAPGIDPATQGTPGGGPVYHPGSYVELAENRTQALDRARDEMENSLRAAIARLLPGQHPKLHVEIDDVIARGIVQCAERIEADLIAMGTHGRTGLSHVLLGSVAEDVIRRSSVPVVVVRPGMRLPSSPG